MKPLLTPCSLADKKTLIFRALETAGFTVRPGSQFARTGGLVVFLVLVASAFYSAASASPPTPAPETVSTFASDCATAGASFNLGDVVCARVTGAPSGQRRLAWVNSFGLVASIVDITTDPQTVSFTLPSSATTTIGDVTGDNRGNWKALLVDSSDTVIRASAPFVVHDPAQTVSDLLVYNFLSTADTTIDVNGNVTTSMYVSNRGPDTASNIQVTEAVPTDTTFVSLHQDSGPSFSCTTPAAGGTGTITCTIPTLPADTPAIFTIVFKLTSVTQNAPLAASVTSDTVDRDITDNSTTSVSTTGGGTAGGGCTADITCPGNITKPADTTQGSESGSITTFTDPSSTCGTVACVPPSGSFFPIGTTNVTCADDIGNSCGFAVRITGPNEVTITINGANPMTVECHTAFSDPGATAVDGSGNTITVTSQVICCDEDNPPNCVTCSVNPNVPGTYAITYTAGTGANAVTATRTVNVVDTTPPTITLIGANTITVECHSSFTDPGATANDTCAGSFPATATGSVNANAPGSYTITYDASDSSGNDAISVTRTVNVVDTLPPVITLNGASSMTVECHTSFTDPGATATDACVGPVGVTPSGTVNANAPGTYTITYTATDGARTATATRTVNVVDTTPPTIACPANVAVTLAANTTATSMAVSYPAVTGSDTCSGVTITSTPASGSVFPVGTTTVTATATDTSGNSSSCTFTVTVLYNFTGFFSPVSNLPTLNSANAGSAIPVKFSLSGNKGLGIFATDSPFTVTLSSCDPNNPGVDVTETVTAGDSSLSYSSGSDQYVYVWKTNSSWAGTCRQLVVKLNDGSSHVANFKFK